MTAVTRCAREVAEIRTRPDALTCQAIFSTMGCLDWLSEYEALVQTPVQPAFAGWHMAAERACAEWRAETNSIKVVVSGGEMAEDRGVADERCGSGTARPSATDHAVGGRDMQALHSLPYPISLSESRPVNVTDWPEYVCWQSMKRRCLDTNHGGYKHYGARGITVHPAWVDDFLAFVHHIGPRPSRDHSIDRYPNLHGNYEPGNVRWATSAEQARNRVDNVVLEFHGERLCATDWAIRVGLPAHAVMSRIAAGWSVTDALTRPVKSRTRSGRSVDLSGKAFGDWTALQRASATGKLPIMYLCRCSCGAEKTVSYSNLKSGASRSCGHTILACFPDSREVPKHQDLLMNREVSR